MAKTIDALFVGALNYDVYINVPNLDGAIEATSIDDTVALVLPSENSKKRIGGGAAITAVALSTLGLSTAVAGSVGNNASVLLEMLKKAGVSTIVAEHPEVPTALTVAYHSPDGRELYRADTQSNRLFTPKDLNSTELLGFVRTSRLVMRTGYPWAPELAGTPTAELFRYARQNGAITALDMSNPLNWPRGMLERLVSEVLPNVEVLCTNAVELYRLANERAKLGSDTSELGRNLTLDNILDYSSKFIRRGVRIVNVHYGEKGTVLVTGSGYVHVPSHRPTKIANPTGTGNLQNAALIYCLLADARSDRIGSSDGFGLDLFYAARFANAAASLRMGGNEFPKLEEVKAAL